jgi:hypothetical protein
MPHLVLRGPDVDGATIRVSNATSLLLMSAAVNTPM